MAVPTPPTGPLNVNPVFPSPAVLQQEADDAADLERLAAQSGESLVNFNDPAFFRKLIEKQGLESVTDDVVRLANNQVDGYEFNLEGMLDGTASIFDGLPSFQDKKSPGERAQTLEQVLTLFSDVQDGVTDSNPIIDPATGEQKIDPETGELQFREPVFGPRMTAVGLGVKESIIPAVTSTAAAVAGATLATAAVAPYAASAAALNPLLGLAITGGAFVTGGITSAVLGGMFGDAADDLIYDDPDPILVPSLQKYYNAAETGTYMLAGSGTVPVLAAKLPGPRIVEAFQGKKFLDAWKDAASGSATSVDQLSRATREALGVKQALKAIESRSKTGSSNKYLNRLRRDPTKGPASVRAFQALTEGSAKNNKAIMGGNGAKTLLGYEALFGATSAVGAFVAEAVDPNAPGTRLALEIAPPVTVPAIVKLGVMTTKGVINGARGLVDGMTAKGMGETMERVESILSVESDSRLYNYLMDQPEFKNSEDPQEKMRLFVQYMLDPDVNIGPGDAAVDGARLVDKKIIEAFDAGPLKGMKPGDEFGPVVDRLNLELETSSNALSIATDRGREQFIQNAMRKIEALESSGNPEALQIAALVKQAIIEEDILQGITNKLSKLDEALLKLYGGEAIPEDVGLELSPKIFDLLKQTISAQKQRTGQLWNKVGNFELTAFESIAPDGTIVETSVPNIVSIFEVPNIGGKGLNFKSAGAEAEFDTILGGYKNDIEEIKEFFQPQALSDVELNGIPVSFKAEEVQLPSEKRLNVLLDQLAGTPSENMPVRDLISLQNSGASTNDIVKSLRDSAKKFREESRLSESGGANKPEFNVLSKAYDEQATLVATTARRQKEVSSTNAEQLLLSKKFETEQAPAENPYDLNKARELLSNLKEKQRGLLTGVNANNKQAMNVGFLIKAIEQDLDVRNISRNLPTTNAEGGVLTPESAQIVKDYTDATSYTRAASNVWNRTIVGKLDQKGSDDAFMYDPENLLEIFKKGGSPVSVKRVQQILRVAQEFDDNTAKQVTNDPAFPEFATEKFQGIDSTTYYNRSGEVVTQPFNASGVEKSVNEAVESVIRNSLRRFSKEGAIDPVTGEQRYTINAEALHKFNNSNEGKQLLSFFPDLKKDLATVDGAMMLLRAEEQGNLALRKTPSNIAFEKLANSSSNSGGVIAGIISDKKGNSPKLLQSIFDDISRQGDVKDPIKGADGLPVLDADGNQTYITYTPKEALEGFRSAILSYAVQSAGGAGTPFNAKTFYSRLFDPMENTDASKNFKLIDFMKRNKMLGDTTPDAKTGQSEADVYVKNLKDYVAQINEVDTYFQSNSASPILFKDLSVAKMGAARIAGAVSASMAFKFVKKMLEKIGLNTGDTMAASLTVNSVGSTMALNLFATGPEAHVISTMTKIMENPKLLALSLKKAGSAKALQKNLFDMYEIMAGTGLRRLPVINRDINADEKATLSVPAGALNVVPKVLGPYGPAPEGFEVLEKAGETQVDESVPNPITTKRPIRQPVAQLQAPQLSTPPGAAGSVAPAAARPTGPVDRNQYAAMFPNDMASGLIRQQGIGSLMG